MASEARVQANNKVVNKLTAVIALLLAIAGCKTFTNINVSAGNSTIDIERSYESTYAPQNGGVPSTNGGNASAESNSTE